MPNDDLLVVNVAALQKASADIQAALNTIHNQLAQLERDAAPLVAGWSGEAREAYDVRQAKWQQAAGDLSAILRDIKQAVDESAADYQRTEHRNTGLFQ
jgi:early secretory antigenic target protein ESAT-6